MDEVSPYTAIKNLKPFKTSWCIQVKILHAWNHYTKGSGMSYEMMLADEDGNKIQAGIKKEHLLKLQSDDELAKHFRENIRAYNMLFSFTSIGGKVDHCLPKGRGPNMFAIQGALKPKSVAKAKFQQLYIVDTENEVNNRYNIMRLRYIKNNQPQFRSSNKESIQNASNSGNNDLENQGMYTIEFQKRGLPHAHILLFMHPTSKLSTAEDTDKVITAEIPDKKKKPELYAVVKDCMIHGPCGVGHPNSPCMENGKCKKYFPKSYSDTTKVDNDGFPVYRRRDTGIYVEKNGHDRVTVTVEPNDQDTAKKEKDEVKDYFDCSKEKKFMIRERGFAIGRINFVPRTIEDAYYLRILLNIKRGVTSSKDLKTVKAVVYKSFRDAVFALGLLDDDKEYINEIKDANFWCSAKYVRRLFVIMLLSESLTKPEMVWDETWKILSEDIERKKRKEWKRPDLQLSDEERQQYCLQEIARLLTKNGVSLSKWKQMPQISDEHVEKCNHFILDERKYDRAYLTEKHEEWLTMVTLEQKKIYDEIMDVVLHDRGGVFFVYGFGGTGKTFLWKLLSAAIRSKGDISLNVASSGIAALLLDGGRTAHSRFGIPINPNESSTCNISRGLDFGELVKEANLIIWDEAHMMSKHCFESLDRTLRDIMNNPGDKPFGGKVIVFGGDFRQVLSVINGAGREEIVFAALNSSYIWEHCKVLELTKNMRLLANISEHEKRDIEYFSKWILDVGDGKISQPNDGIALIDPRRISY
ncbi:unknown protein; 11471-16325 [Arabidopsis thaliana]|uniref:ATP-dependent DNA helicase n=1 Tax=Arabidopsis thaliana TaxID=3702 RepID=Q9C7W5_ARATH|nr:unknown protein; 11471-16325 [Arabidopsis thaliana]